MADFYVSLTNPTTSVADLTATGGILTIGDNSNYDTSTELGHLQADFSDWVKIIITNPDGTTHTYASDGSGDSTIDTPDTYSSNPKYTSYDYTDHGDGVYLVQLMAVPTWSFIAAIDGGWNTGDYVYFGGNLYTCIGTAVTGDPTSSPLDWQEVEEEDLPVKYSVQAYTSVYCCIEACKNEYVVLANPCSDTCSKINLCENENYKAAMKLSIAIQAIETLSANEDWTKVEQIINMCKRICTACT